MSALVGLLALITAQQFARGELEIVGLEDARGPTRAELGKAASLFIGVRPTSHAVEGPAPVLRALPHPSQREGWYQLELVAAGAERAFLQTVVDLRKPEVREQRIGAAVTEILGNANYRRGGQLTITATPKNAELMLENGTTIIPVLEPTLTVAPGLYTLRGRAPGHEDGVSQIQVHEGWSAFVAMNLKEHESSISSSPIFWIGGISAAVLTGGVVAVLIAAAGSSGGGPAPSSSFCYSPTGACAP